MHRQFGNGTGAVCLGMAVMIAFILSAADAFSGQAASCRECPATPIKSGEIATYLARAIADGVLDQQMRSVDVGKSHVAVALIHRKKLDAPAPRSVAAHDLVSEVYYIVEGTATIVTGHRLVNPVRRAPSSAAVLTLNGPGLAADSIEGGIEHQLAPGDMLVVPAGTGHWFTKIDDHITYVMVRVDPDKVTPLKGAPNSLP